MRKLAEGRPGRLAGRTLFLSASVPTRLGFRRVEDAAFEIEQTVVAFVRTVLAEQGRLVFGGHPSISPLVAAVASEYFPPSVKPEDGRILIYQSRAYELVLPDETWEMHRFGYAQIQWTEAVDGERFDPSQPVAQCPKSLAHMRENMLAETDPDVMMAIGGMEGVLQEAELFAEFARKAHGGRPKSIYVVRATGGGAEQLADGTYELANGYRIHRLEEEWKSSLKVQPALVSTDSKARGERRFTPYPVMMQWLVEHLATP
jgi:hypothetical protein